MKDFIHVYENQFSNDLCDRLITLFENCDRKNVTMQGDSGIRNISDVKKQSRDIDLHRDFAQGKFAIKLGGRDKSLYSDIKTNIDAPILEYVNCNIPNFRGETDYLSLDYSKNIFMPVQPFKIKRYRAPSEGYHAWHQDWGKGVAQKRMLVVMIYLNDVSEGGETVFYHQGIKVKPEKGKMVIFPPYFTHMHKGNKPISNDKYICNCYIGIN